MGIKQEDAETIPPVNSWLKTTIQSHLIGKKKFMGNQQEDAEIIPLAVLWL